MIRTGPGTVTSPQLRELDVAWRNAVARVPLATSRVTVLKPYAWHDLAGQYNWEDRGFNSVDIGVPGLGTETEPISGEHAPVFKPVNHAYYYARLAFPHSKRQRLIDRLRGGQGAALAARQWSLWPVGTHNLEAFLVHERAHGQSLEARVFIGDFKEKMFAAVAGALGVPTIDRRSLAGARNRREAREIARAERTQLEIRVAIADEFGLYAATLPAPTSRRHPWNELWPSFVTMMEYAPGYAGPVSQALQPLREEVAAIPPDRQRLYLYGRLDSRAMSSEELDLLMREQFDLYVVAMARSGRVNAHTATDLLAQARHRGVELDVAYLKTATTMGDFMPSLHGPPASRPGSGGLNRAGARRVILVRAASPAEGEATLADPDGTRAVRPTVTSTEVPAELIAGDLALAIREGHIRPGEPLPSAGRLVASYHVPPATVSAALGRLSRAGVIGGDPDQGMFAQELGSGGPRQALDVMAVPALCRRLASTPAVVTGPHFDPAALRQASEVYLSAGRRARDRHGLTNDDARLVAAARDLLDDAAGKNAPPPPWDRPPAAGGTLKQRPAGLDWPATATDGIAAAPARTARSPRPLARPSRPPSPGRSA